MGRLLATHSFNYVTHINDCAKRNVCIGMSYALPLSLYPLILVGWHLSEGRTWSYLCLTKPYHLIASFFNILFNLYVPYLVLHVTACQCNFARFWQLWKQTYILQPLDGTERYNFCWILDLQNQKSKQNWKKKSLQLFS